MNLAKVVGQVVANQKIEGLVGAKFLLVDYLDEKNKQTGKRVVAVDTVRAGIGDTVSCVSSREAALALEPFFVPIDSAIIGIVDSINVSL